MKTQLESTFGVTSRISRRGVSLGLVIASALLLLPSLTQAKQITQRGRIGTNHAYAASLRNIQKRQASVDARANKFFSGRKTPPVLSYGVEHAAGRDRNAPYNVSRVYDDGGRFVVVTPSSVKVVPKRTWKVGTAKLVTAEPRFGIQSSFAHPKEPLQLYRFSSAGRTETFENASERTVRGKKCLVFQSLSGSHTLRATIDGKGVVTPVETSMDQTPLRPSKRSGLYGK